MNKMKRIFDNCFSNIPDSVHLVNNSATPVSRFCMILSISFPCMGSNLVLSILRSFISSLSLSKNPPYSRVYEGFPSYCYTDSTLL